MNHWYGSLFVHSWINLWFGANSLNEWLILWLSPLFTLTTYWVTTCWKVLGNFYFNNTLVLYIVSYLNDKKHLLHVKVNQPSFSHICARCAVYRRLTSDHRHYIKTRFWEVLSELTTLCRIINWHDSLVYRRVRINVETVIPNICCIYLKLLTLSWRFKDGIYSNLHFRYTKDFDRV